MAAKVIQVIQTDDLRGRGVQVDPYRRVDQFYSLEGDLMWERDEWAECQERERQPTATALRGAPTQQGTVKE